MVAKNLASFMLGLAKDQRTGTLMCIGNRNNLGRIYVIEGKAVTARYGHKQGAEALQIIHETPFESIKFHEGYDLVRSRVMMNEGDNKILNYSGHLTGDKLRSSLNVTKPALGSASDRSIDIKLTPALCKMLTEILMDHLGPVASIMVNDLDQEITLKEAINKLAQIIDDVDSSIKFINTVKQRI